MLGFQSHPFDELIPSSRDTPLSQPTIVTQTHSHHPSLQASNHQIIQHEVLLNQAHLVTLALAYRSGSDGSSQNNRSKPISQTRLAAYTAPCMPKHSVAGLQSRDLDLAICRPSLFVATHGESAFCLPQIVFTCNDEPIIPRQTSEQPRNRSIEVSIYVVIRGS